MLFAARDISREAAGVFLVLHYRHVLRVRFAQKQVAMF